MAGEAKRNPWLEGAPRILGAVVAIYIAFTYFRPEPPPVTSEELVVGDPISACAYPATEFGPKKVEELTQIDGVRPVVFDEFAGWSLAHRAGYIDCK